MKAAVSSAIYKIDKQTQPHPKKKPNPGNQGEGEHQIAAYYLQDPDKFSAYPEEVFIRRLFG